MKPAFSLQPCVQTIPARGHGGASGAALAGRVLIRLCCWLLCLCSATNAEEAGPQQPVDGRPFFRARQHQTGYAGPGRELPPPAEVEEVLIGYFGPSDPEDPRGGDMWRAAQMAVEEANAAGGYQGKPLRLLPVWSENPWGTGVGQLARMVYQDRVWAVLGGMDGESTHLAEQVVAKARLTLLSPASSDKTVNLANVPWMFSCLPGDHVQAPVLAAEIEARLGGKPLTVVSTDDHDPRLFALELGKSLAGRRIAPRYRFECKRGTCDTTELATRIVQSEAAAVVLIAGPDDSACLLKAVRSRGFRGLVFGGPAMGRSRFLQEAGAAAEGVVFPVLCEPGEERRGFASSFQSRFGRLPDYAAAHSYDAVRLLVAAIDKAGLNRARIRDAVEELSPWAGATGPIRWDRLGANTRPVVLGTIRNGQVVSPADLAPVHTVSRAR